MRDVLIYSDAFANLLALLVEARDRFLDHKMFAKCSKCNFGVQSIEQLGYGTFANGIRPIPHKIQAVARWPAVVEHDAQVRQCLGNAKYRRNFRAPEFAVLTRPLQQLIRHGAKPQWTYAHIAAAKALKHSVINYTLLSLRNPKSLYVVQYVVRIG